MFNFLIGLKNQLDSSSSHGYFCFNDIEETYTNWGKEWNYQNGEYFLKDNYKNNEPIKFIDWFKNNINETYPNPIKIFCNAIFAVKKEQILSRPIEYYKNLILEVNHHVNSTEGHFFERSWYYIFNLSY